MRSPDGDRPTIPLVDIRDGGPPRRAVEGEARARALRAQCLEWFPRPTRVLIPVFDRLARQWLQRARSPYVHEIEAIAAALGLSGVWLLNGSYQWFCTALAREEHGIPWLARTLDWPFHGLGRHVEIAHMRGPAGEFYNVTWPGYVGVLTAMAPGRFALAVNQAPLRRRTRHPWLRPLDIVLNAISTWRHARSMPVDHLVREVFETCRTYSEAKLRLETTPLATPVIFTLAGCERGQRCVVERTTEAHETRNDDTAAANDWLRPDPSWEARVGGELTLNCTFAEAAENSRLRRETLAAWQGRFAVDSFEWVVPPVLNPYTRVAVEMCPALGTLRVLGYEMAPASDLPRPVTLAREVAALPV